MADSLTRTDIIDGLRDLVAELHLSREVAGIRLVGGAALVIRYFDRRTTGDLDSLHIRPGSDDAVLAAAARVGDRRGWSAGWFSFAVEHADSLLAMKLRANRPGRDTDDIRQLLALCNITSLEDVEEFYEDFYPGDGLTNRAVGIVERILSDGLPAEVPSPGPIDL